MIMKGIFLIIGIALSMLIVPAYAQVTSEFGYQLHPEKLLENTEGTLQVFVSSNDMMVPKEISNLKAISSDNSIIEILGIEDSGDKFTKNILIKAKNPGSTTIALAAQGFSSKEIALEVFNNNNYPTQILMKITPNEFPVDGPKYGHIVVELATTGGIPTIASEDTTIVLDTPNKDVIKIKDTNIDILKGEYYAITEFEIIGSGDAIIFAETDNMKKISSLVNVIEAVAPLKLQLYTFPENYNSHVVTKGYAIIQLVDGEGTPVLAEEDINFKLSVENPDVSINTSNDYEEINFDKKDLVIKKGTYSTYTEFTPRLNLGDITELTEQTLNVFISVENYLTSESSIKITHDEIGTLEGDGPSVTQVVPFLTTGNQEIVGVTYYEADIEIPRRISGTSTVELVTVTVPVQAKENHALTFSSSNTDVVNPINPVMKKGNNALIVFGETGTVMSDDSTVFSITDNEGVKTAVANPIGPLKSEISLIVEPLVPMILAESEFPVLAYLTDSGEVTEEILEVEEGEGADTRSGITPFIDDSVLTFSANEFVETDYVTIERNQAYANINMLSNKVGSTTLTYQMGGFGGATDIVSHTTDPAKIHVASPKNILANSNTLATVQILDSSNNPVYAKEDIRIKLVSNDEEIIKIPQELTIKEGEYFTMFELQAINEGSIELAVLTEDMSLTKHDLTVVDISPVLALNLKGGMNWNERLEAKLSVTIPEIQTSLDGFMVAWEVEGGEIMKFDEETNSDGIAVMNIMANDQETIQISAKVSGNGLSSSELSESAQILNRPVDENNEVIVDVEEKTNSDLPIDINTLILIIIPVAIGGTLFMLKRMDKLDTIADKIPLGDKLNIGDKVEEIKERISDIRNR